MRLAVATVLLGAGCSFTVPGFTPEDAGARDLAGSSVDLARDFAGAPDLANADLASADLAPPDLTPVTGVLTVSCVDGVQPGGANLTTEGLTDWMHWGLSAASDVNRKNGGAAITGFTSAPLTRRTANATSFSWTDGTPTLTATNQAAGVSVTGNRQGFTFNVGSDTTQDQLKLYVGGYNTEGTLTLTLSDGSATASPVVLNTGASGNDYAGVCTVIFRAASAGQRLSVDWRITATSGGHWLALQAATIQ